MCVKHLEFTTSGAKLPMTLSCSPSHCWEWLFLHVFACIYKCALSILIWQTATFPKCPFKVLVLESTAYNVFSNYHFNCNSATYPLCCLALNLQETSRWVIQRCGSQCGRIRGCRKRQLGYNVISVKILEHLDVHFGACSEVRTLSGY